MTNKERNHNNQQYLLEHHSYEMLHHSKFDYSILKFMPYRFRSGKKNDRSINECIMMLDTETSKKKSKSIYHNHVVAWTISIRAYHMNIVTLWGHKPSTLVETVMRIINHLPGDDAVFYVHNLNYDWTFLRKFFLREFFTPGKQLNTKSHYPINIQWDSGLILRDSLILAQRGLDKWGEDLDVFHKKSVGKWDYDIIRNQDYIYNKDELEYIEHDTLCGVECIDALMSQLNKSLYSMPYTATGIPREEVRKRGKKEYAHKQFRKISVSEYSDQVILERVYHGGYTHANRHYIGWIFDDVPTACYDFASSYPYTLLSERFPCEKFGLYPYDVSPDWILDRSEQYAFYFKLCIQRVEIKYWELPMPALQYSKTVREYNSIIDNGRILYSEYVEIYLTEQDLAVIMEQYNFKDAICTEVHLAMKDYLPRWLTDYIYNLFVAKTRLKDSGDAVAYALAKAKLNSIYGMMVQKPVKDTITEDYQTGEYTHNHDIDFDELYQKFLDKHGSVLPYQWGIWVTAYAFRNLFRLGECCELWLYSDTDSCYGQVWNDDMIKSYNQKCREKLLANGYGAVNHNGKDYWLGFAEFDGSYSEYVVLGSKRYCGRSAKTGELQITVAGVPKKGVCCLNNDIKNFKEGLIFSGEKTGKRTHTYFYIDDIYIDDNGNETGDSIDLSPCDYLLDKVHVQSIDEILDKYEVEIQVYGEG